MHLLAVVLGQWQSLHCISPVICSHSFLIFKKFIFIVKVIYIFFQYYILALVCRLRYGGDYYFLLWMVHGCINIILAMFTYKINSYGFLLRGERGVSVQYYATIFMLLVGTYIEIKNLKGNLHILCFDEPYHLCLFWRFM